MLIQKVSEIQGLSKRETQKSGTYTHLCSPKFSIIKFTDNFVDFEKNENRS